MEDELIKDLGKLIDKYANRYNKKGVKKDRLRRRILVSLIDGIIKRLNN